MQSSHTDFGQAGYPQQYGYPPSISSVPGNSGHDISKQVAAGQPGMFPNSGGMPTAAQHHHQSAMGGPVPNPQSASLVQQGQQINRGNQITGMQSFYTRTNVPRSMPNMGRNPLTTVVNQTGQQPSSQYSHAVQMLPSASFHHTLPQIMVNQYPQVYQQRQYNPQQFVISQGQPLYLNNWNNFNNPPPPSSNGFYQHGMQTFNTMPPQMPPQQIPVVQQPQQRKKAVPIINPDTGKNIFEASSDEVGPRPAIEKETENADPNICVQFATQVAATLNSSRNDPLSKSPSVDDTRSMDSQNVVLCSTEIETVRIDETETSETCDVESLGELADIDSLGDIEYIESRSIPCIEEPAVSFLKDDIDPIHISERIIYDNEKCTSKNVDSVPVTELRDPKVYMVSEDLIHKENENLFNADLQTHETCAISENSQIYCEVSKEAISVLSTEFDSSKTSQDIVQPVVNPSNLFQDDTTIPEDSIEVIPSCANISKLPDKSIADGKKNKAKKKKDYNKRGESKEGGDMDAFIVEGEDVAAPPPPVSAVPEFFVDRLPSPVPIVDSEILSTIPLPGESFDNFPQNDISPSEPTSETSSVSPSAESEEKENSGEEPSNKIILKYSYKEDQWSPLNPEGKKQYDRDFLLQLQSQPMSLTKPTNLPNLDVIKDKAHIQRLTEVSRIMPQMVPQMRPYDPFMPNYARGGPARMPHPPVNRRSQTNRGEKPRKVITFNSLSQTVKLHESENAWKPGHKSEPTVEKNPDDMVKDKLKRSVQGVLNKLTPQKFDTLLNQLKNLNIDTEEKLNVVIDLIFEKAVDEPNFSVPYANLCKQLATIKVPLVGGQPGQMVNFRKLLLTKCQKEFEQDRCDEIKHEERMKAIEAAEPDKQKELKLVYEDEEKKMRYRQLGNIRFIGELFKLGMLIEPIMHECIKKLLSQGDEESLECLCRLLKTIGKELDEGKAAKGREPTNLMDAYFSQMQKTVEKRLTSSRVRFMLQDVIDLKKGNWVPRRDENNPKTIDQIHKEAEREAREQQQVYQNMSSYPKRIPDDRDRRKSTGRNIGQSEDGWTPSSKSSKTSYTVVDPTKLKLTKPDEVDSMRLGPGGKGMQSWGRGSSGGTKTIDSDAKTTLTNRYSALAEQPAASGYEGRRGSQRSAASSRESSRGRSNQMPPAIRKTPSASKERENLLETVKGLAKSFDTKAQDVKKSSDVHLNGKTIDSEDLCLRGPEYSEDDMERKTKPLIDEFLHNNDFEEAIKCITELASPNTVHMFINAAINQVLERSSQARISLGTLLYSLVKKKVITIEHYKKGFGGVLEFLDDYALDIPLIWEYIGEIIEPMIEDNEFPITLLKEVLQPCIPSESAGLLVSAVLHSAAKRKGTIKLGEVWQDSGLQWTDFFGNDTNVNEFIQKHKLEFTLHPQIVKPNVQMTLQEMKKNLSSLLEKSEQNEEIFDWIDANVSENTDPNFIRALVPAVLETAISESNNRWEFDAVKLKTRSPLLTRYIGHKDTLELQAVYSIQVLINAIGHPVGLLHQIFDVLYDDDVITDVTFWHWKLNDDPNESEGKGIATSSVQSFFTWLSEADDSPGVADEEADE